MTGKHPGQCWHCIGQSQSQYQATSLVIPATIHTLVGVQKYTHFEIQRVTLHAVEVHHGVMMTVDLQRAQYAFTSHALSPVMSKKRCSKRNPNGNQI